MAEREVALRVSRLSKAFPSAQALLDVDLDVRRGEIHALVGGNGSGKSTLVKILAGVHGPDAGTIEVGSRIFRHGLRPGEGRAAGLHFVHQDPMVFLDLSIADNLAIGRGFETDGTGRIRWRDVRSRTREILERFEIDAQPEMHVGALRPSERTMVAIARALQDQEGQRSGVLVLDEPTTSLPDPEAALLAQHQGTWLIRAAGSDILKLFPVAGSLADHIYVVDPLGNLMMRYPRDGDPRKMLKDIARLLRHSKWQ